MRPYLNYSLFIREQPVNRADQAQETRIVGFLGVGFDHDDDHKRITRSDNFLLVGGSEQTHELMQDTAIYFDEALQKRGKTLEMTSTEEAIDLLRQAMDR